MPNPLFRERFIARIGAALAEYQCAAALSHAGSKGRAREIAVSQLLSPSLPTWVASATGHIVDSHGQQSRQMDVILFDPRLLAPLMFDAVFGAIPVEASLFTIEVKSRLDATGIAMAIEHARSVDCLEHVHGQFSWLKTHNAVFAFDSDLAGQGKSEIDRYFEHDNQAEMSPAIDTVCVVGRGFWRFRGGEGWTFCPPTDHHDEVIDFIGVLVNSLPGISASRGQPAWGPYVIQERQVHLVRRVGQT